mmetsp:Transcript_17793/g.58121  ORF Transcript_17793/g.58121 Transcript_17793/m.58121 type:complete len:226 (-) Transcript_17793:5-682(-)
MAWFAYGLAKTENCDGPMWCAHDSKNWMNWAPDSIWKQAYSPMATAMLDSAAWSTSGAAVIIFLVRMQCRFASPSTAYATKVKGEPTKPSSDVLPSVSRRSARSVSATKGSLTDGSPSSVMALTSAIERSGVVITGPDPLITSNSMPRAGSGVRMSLNMMTPSTPNACHGCRLSSIAISGVSERMRNGYLSDMARKSFMYRPACRISQTGARSTGSPPAAPRRMS